MHTFTFPLRRAAYALFGAALLFSIGMARAQQPDDLTAREVEVIDTVDIYGQTVPTATGVLENAGDAAYTNITLYAEAFDADDALIGEGFGTPVNACGAGLLFEFALQPGAVQAFTVPLELFERGAIARVEITPQAQPTDPLPPAPALPDGITPIADGEVVSVEWESNREFRYGMGCDRDLFTALAWYRYRGAGASEAIEHPRADAITPDVRERLELTDDLIFENSQIHFGLASDRLVYQDRVNRIHTAANDGTLIRRLYDRLNGRTLQGIHWLPEDRFVAYYFGAYGDPVIYFTADSEARAISRGPLQNKPSVIVPGVSRDGRRAIIAGTFDGVTGYYIDLLSQNFFELLFEAEPSGNNYPAPIPILNAAGDRVEQIYLIRPVEGENRLQCFYRPEGVEPRLIDIAPVPIQLATDERAWAFPSPDEREIALAANGVNGGLWLLDLDALPPCE